VNQLARVVADGDGEIPIAAIEGEIDASNTVEIGEAIHALLSNRTTALVLDLAPTRYLDSAGINLLFELGAELRDRQQQLHLVVAAGSPIARMVEISGLAATERTHPTRAEALAGARA
jgi:anti-anti-sigma factor